MTIELIKNISSSLQWVPEALTLLAALSLLLKRVRAWVMIFLKGLFVWFLFPFKSQDIRLEILTEIGGIKKELEKNTQISQKTAKDVDALKEIIGYNGGSGLMDIVGYIEGLQNSDFWHRHIPAFICDGEGRNLEVTYPYCSLLGVSTKSDLSGISWKSYTETTKSSNYLSEFRDAASRGESFRGKIEFFDIHSDSLGYWVIVMNMISTKKAKTKRYFGALYPADETSKNIAEKHGWPMNVPL